MSNYLTTFLLLLKDLSKHSFPHTELEYGLPNNFLTLSSLKGEKKIFGFGDEDDEDLDEDAEPPRLTLRSGGAMPSQEAMRAVFGMSQEENISASNPEQLVPYARRQVARQRQQMLATMVKMGMQRIVIDSGKINASMRFSYRYS